MAGGKMNNCLIVLKSCILTALIMIILMITLVPEIEHIQPNYVNNKSDWVGFNIPMSKTSIKMLHKDWTKETDIYLTTIEKEL